MSMSKADFEVIAANIKRKVDRFRDEDLQHAEDSIRYYERGFRSGVLEMVSSVISSCCNLNTRFNQAWFVRLCGLTYNPNGDLIVREKKEKTV